MNESDIRAIINARAYMRKYAPARVRKDAEEGGCGVTGFACSIPVSGRHIFEPSVQMHNRGNGKGGGIAAAGLDARALGVSQEVLNENFLLPHLKREILNIYQIIFTDQKRLLDNVGKLPHITGEWIKDEKLRCLRTEMFFHIVPLIKPFVEILYQGYYIFGAFP